MRTPPTGVTRRQVLGTTAAMATLPILERLRSRRDGEQPNIVLILADDLGIETLGCYGGESWETPRLDAMAAAGIRFEHAFSTPLCAPSRAQLMSGRYPFHTKIDRDRIYEARGAIDFDPALGTLAICLRDAGYDTGVFGKWHLASLNRSPHHPQACGFEESVCFRAKELYWDAEILRNGKILGKTKGQFAPDIYHRAVLDFVRAERDRPFFAYYPMQLPHAPLTRVPGLEETNDERELFAAMLRYLDSQVGGLLDAVSAKDSSRDTVVMFTSDNGTASDVRSKWRGRDVRGGKNSLRDAGIRVPLIVLAPGHVEAGRVSDALVDLSDFLPTLGDLGRVPADKRPQGDGQSFAPVLAGAPGAREWIYAQLGDAFCIRDQHWKYSSNGRFLSVEAPGNERVDLRESGDPDVVAARERLAGAAKELRGEG